MEDDDDKEEPAPLAVPKPTTVPVAQSAIDLTAEFLHPLLNPENVANLVSSNNRLLLHFFKCACMTKDLITLSCLISGAHQHGVST